MKKLLSKKFRESEDKIKMNKEHIIRLKDEEILIVIGSLAILRKSDEIMTELKHKINKQYLDILKNEL